MKILVLQLKISQEFAPAAINSLRNTQRNYSPRTPSTILTFRSLKAQLCNFRHDFFKATEVLDNDVSGIYNYLLSPLYYRIPDAIANNYIKFILPTSDLLLKYVTELTGEKAKRGRGDTARGKRCEKKRKKIPTNGTFYKLLRCEPAFTSVCLKCYESATGTLFFNT